MRNLDDHAREMLIELFENKPFISRDELKEFIKPYVDFDPDKAYDQELTKEVNSLIATTFRDSQDIRQCFMCKMEGMTVFAHTEKTDDIKILENILNNLTAKRTGLDRSIKKLANKLFNLKYQINISDWQEQQAKNAAN
jgi:hypothetical protein